MNSLLIAAIGSHQDGDELAWQLLEHAQQTDFALPGWHLEWRCIEHPAVDLLPALREAQAACVLDVLPQATQPVQALSPAMLAQHQGVTSSHVLSVAEALALGESLGLLPSRLLVLGLQPDQPVQRLLEKMRDLLQTSLGPG